MNAIVDSDVCAFHGCGGDSKVVDTRSKGGKVARRRECLRCGERWTSWEVRVTAENLDHLNDAVRQSDH